MYKKYSYLIEFDMNSIWQNTLLAIRNLSIFCFLQMFHLPPEVLRIIYAFDGTYRDKMEAVFHDRVFSMMCLSREMRFDRGYAIRNYVETGWHSTPRYVIVNEAGRLEKGGGYLRYNEHGRRCFASAPL